MKKVDFLDWKQEHNLRESAVVAKYGLSDRDEYLKVNINSIYDVPFFPLPLTNKTNKQTHLVSQSDRTSETIDTAFIAKV